MEHTTRHRRRMRSTRAHASVMDVVQRVSLHTVDAGLAALLLFAPWFMGGRHPLGQLVVVALATMIGIAWPIHQLAQKERATWRSAGGAELIMLCAVGLVFLQIMPVSAQMLQTLSPRLVEILPLWMSGTGESGSVLGQWNTVSLAPDATRVGLVMLLAYCTIFLVTLQRLHSIEDVEKLMRVFVVAGLLLAVVGVLQYWFSNGRFLWVYQHVNRGTDDAVKGPFINKNHFAHILALVLPAILWGIQKALNSKRPSRKTQASGFGNSESKNLREIFESVPAQFTILAIVLLAGLLSFSRGGMAALAVSAVISTLLMFRASLLGMKFLAGSIATGVIALGVLSFHGLDEVTSNIEDYTAVSLDQLDSSQARRKIWAADWQGAQDFMRLGTGVGSHRVVYEMYFPDSWGSAFTHAENGYLQVALETGVPGVLLLLGGIALCFYWCSSAIWRSSSKRQQALLAVVTASLLASVVHSAVDFVWYITSCMTFTVMLIACACRLYQLSYSTTQSAALQTTTLNTAAPGHSTATAAQLACRWLKPLPGYGSMVMLLLAGFGGSLGIQNRFCAAMAAKHWDSYQFAKRMPEAEAQVRTFDNQTIDQLKDYLHWAPNDGRAHLSLARLYIDGFERIQAHHPVNAMPLNQIRSAALGSFESADELKLWLTKAVGPHYQVLGLARWHARRGLSLAPLEGEGYAHLSSTDFLDPQESISEDRYIQQAALVRPHHEAVLSLLGSKALLRGDVEAASSYWKKVLANNSPERRQLIDRFALQQLPVEMLLTEFEPNLSAMRAMFRRYRSPDVTVDISALATRYRDATVLEAQKLSGRNAAQQWLEAHEAALALNQTDQAIEFANQAVNSDSANFSARMALGQVYLKAAKFEEAEAQFRWCLQRRPDHKQAKAAFETAVKQRVSGTLYMANEPAKQTTR